MASDDMPMLAGHPNGRHEERPNPYTDRRRRIADDRYGDQIRARNWRLIAVACAIGWIASTIGNVVAIMRPSAVPPMIVAVDKLQNVVGVAYPQRQDRTSEADIRTALSLWITAARTVWTDPKADATNLSYVYGRARGDAVRFLNAYYQADGGRRDPRNLSASQATDVTIKSILAQTPSTFIVEWNEDYHDRVGRPLGGARDYEAVITVTIVPPTDERTIIENPHGIYVTSVSWQPIGAFSR